ncbi:BnaA01g35800D [Brassica napus]|uniref:BnaA01g35800D protein n=1 Tax=Brassica napus TaxID=3708 RepID=A0A078IB12_BRANA|nr:BnaA01g35800D [Brassica napus]
MGDVNANAVPTQADINAQLMAGQAQLTATMNAVTEQLARMEQRNRPNDPLPMRRNHPYLEDPPLFSDEDTCPSRVGPHCLGLVDFSLSKRVHVVFASSPLEGHSCRFA